MTRLKFVTSLAVAVAVAVLLGMQAASATAPVATASTPRTSVTFSVACKGKAVMNGSTDQAVTVKVTYRNGLPMSGSTETYVILPSGKKAVLDRKIKAHGSRTVTVLKNYRGGEQVSVYTALMDTELAYLHNLPVSWLCDANYSEYAPPGTSLTATIKSTCRVDYPATKVVCERQADAMWLTSARSSKRSFTTVVYRLPCKGKAIVIGKVKVKPGKTVRVAASARMGSKACQPGFVATWRGYAIAGKDPERMPDGSVYPEWWRFVRRSQQDA